MALRSPTATTKNDVTHDVLDPADRRELHGGRLRFNPQINQPTSNKMDADAQTQLVYQAEAWLEDEHRGKHFRTLSEVRDFLDRIFSSRWFQRNHRNLCAYDLRDGRGAKRGIGGLLPGGIARITLPRGRLRCELFVLHELAHSLAHDGHGPHYLFAYVNLVRRFIGREAATALRVSLTSMRARQRRPPEYDGHGLARYQQILEQRRQRQAALYYQREQSRRRLLKSPMDKVAF